MDSTPAYSVQNSIDFKWSSVTGDLSGERVQHLERYLCGKEILDAGCGGGAFVEFLSARGFLVTGLDYHEMFLDVARKRPGAVGTYVQGDITALPFPDKSFDCAYCYDVLEHVDDQKALRELLRVTRSRVIIAVPRADDASSFGPSLTFQHYRDLTHLRAYTRQSLETLFHSLGQHQFEIVPELYASVHALASEHLDDTQVTARLPAFARKFYHRVLRRMLRYGRYRSIHTGWAAAIDVEAVAAPSAETHIGNAPGSIQGT